MVQQAQPSTTANHKNSISNNDSNNKNNKNNKNKTNSGSSNNVGRGDGAPQRSPVLGTTPTVAKQLNRQRRGWQAGHVRQILRCRPNLIQRVIGRTGVGLRSIVVSEWSEGLDLLQ